MARGSNNNNSNQVRYGEIYDDETSTNGGSSKYGTNYTTTNGNEEFTNIDNYEEYLSNLPMGIEPISEEEFYTRHSSNRYLR